ncbi:MAG: MFS transporter [Myxococcaceae bacterium]|nr:MFS transporter [Myxococcaceae bacterium]
MPDWLAQLLPIVLLLTAVAVVLSRLPKVDVGHSEAFKRRRFLNWFPLGLTYAFLYMGRYNLSANAKALDAAALLSKHDYGTIDGWSAAIYGLGFLVTGPLTDTLGGRKTILIAAGGSAIANFAMGIVLQMAMAGQLTQEQLTGYFTVLACFNMFCQSFGAVSIVKVNASWFHLKERGTLGGVFGILISLGLYFAYDWTRYFGKELGLPWAFFIPTLMLVTFFVLSLLLIRDTPAQAGLQDFDAGDASSGLSADVKLTDVLKRMLSQKVIWIIVAIEFCSGFLRNGVMKWYLNFAGDTGQGKDFLATNWGVVLCVAGILGGVFAGTISDRIFDSRRGPVSAVLYGGMTVGTILAFFLLETPLVGWAMVLMSLCVIGVHGMLSGTASADFGGKKGAGIATGVIDGFVYLGTALQGFIFGHVLPKGDLAKDAANWKVWPLAMLPAAIVGLVLATLVWNAKPKSNAAAH